MVAPDDGRGGHTDISYTENRFGVSTSERRQLFDLFEQFMVYVRQTTLGIDRCRSPEIGVRNVLVQDFL